MLEHRSFHGVEVTIERGLATEAGEAARIHFPAGAPVQIRTMGFDNTDEAAAAEVAVWRIRRIRRGIDRPEGVTRGQRTF